MSARRNARLRREYLHRKAAESTEKALETRKRRLKEAIDAGKSIPRDLRGEEGKLRASIQADDDVTAIARTRIDDEYAFAGIKEPRVCVTTSRDPSSRLKQFIKEVRLIFPNAQRINRGNTKLDELVEACRTNDFTDLVVVQEHRGEPVNLIVSHLPYGPTAYFALSNCVMRHDIEDRGTISEAYPHLIFDGFTTPLGDRVKSILRFMFPVPKEDSRRVITFANRDDFISFRHHNYVKTGPKEVQLAEIGPRFELRPYHIALGTLDQGKSAETEWVLRPYMNTAKKRRAL